jgi:hypothetical protein
LRKIDSMNKDIKILEELIKENEENIKILEENGKKMVE